MSALIRFPHACLAIALAGVCGVAQAGLYFGGAATWAERDSYDDIDGSGGGRAILGYRFEQLPLMLEANYLDAGKADIHGPFSLSSGLVNPSLEFTGGIYTIGFFLPLSPWGSGVWIKGGGYSGDAKLKDPQSPDADSGGYLGKRSTSGPVFGIGGVWKLTDQLGLRLDFESLGNVEDFADNEDMSVISLGLVFEFLESPAWRPERRRAPVSYPPPPPPRPPYSAPEPRPYGSAPPQSRSQAPDDSAWTAGSVEMKSQPRQSSPTLVVLPEGAQVQPGQREDNIEGSWTFVLYGRYSGWVPSDALDWR